MEIKTTQIPKNIGGYAVVEATIFFPFIIMVMCGLVLLSLYLPERALLQRATQYAATGIATARSDEWLEFDENGYTFADSPEYTVYGALFKANDAEAEAVVKKIYEDGIVVQKGELTVDCTITNYIIYKEVTVTAKKTITVPVDLSFVSFPKTIDLEVSSTAVVQNGDEFIRDMDIAVDFIEFIDEKYHISSSEIFQKVKTVKDKVENFLAG